MTTPPLPFSRTPHLVGLVAEAERLAARVASAPVSARATAQDAALAEAAVASLRLDGSTVTAPPVVPDADVLAAAAVPTDTAERPGTWLDAMDVVAEDELDSLVPALEYSGVRAALASDDLADRVVDDLTGTLAELHRRLARGLVAPDVAGRLRTTDQAVHDASQGRIIFFAPDPATLPGALAHLATWMASAGAREHALLVSGVLHYHLLALHPFEAANGRLARAAARLVLRARHLDPDGLTAPEGPLAEDAIGYYEEVAATSRRRDLTIWLERWGEAVTEGLRRSARSLALVSDDVPDRAEAFVTARSDPAFTIADYRADVGVGPEDARADLEALLDAGRIGRVPASRGLRYLVRT